MVQEADPTRALRDAFGMILGYHEKDFVKAGSVYDSSHSTTSSWHVPNPTFLYNGNISSWAWNSRRTNGATDTALASVYHYDLLNRIRSDSMRLRGASAWSTVDSHWQSDYTYDGNGNITTLNRADASGEPMDNLTYEYIANTNKLVNINDSQGASAGADIGDQNGNNYAYDATGNMTQDESAGIEAGGIVWSPYNKIKSITKMGDDTTSKLVYLYDATGNRILKRYYKPYNTLRSTTWYVRDAQGNTLATYTKPSDSTTARQQEVMIYGSTRLAIAQTQAPYSDTYTDTIPLMGYVSSRTLGAKQYELTDHLGNVRATVSDIVIKHYTNLDAELSTRTDYYPFGMIMGGRNSSVDTPHRYGFNGKENDNEVKGEGVQQDYGFRNYDARVGRFLSVDPLHRDYPWNSTYSFAEGDAIRAIDIDGGERLVVIYDFSSDKITKTKIQLDKSGPLGDGVLVKSNHGGEDKYFYGRDITSPTLSSFKKAYEGVRLNSKGEHVCYLDSKGNPTIGYGHLVKKGESYRVGSTISEADAQKLFEKDVESIMTAVDKKLASYSLTINQKYALYDASFNMGPGKLSQYSEGDGKFSGENFFLKFMGDGNGVSKRRYAESLLYGDGLYVHLDYLNPKRSPSTHSKAITVVESAVEENKGKSKTPGSVSDSVKVDMGSKADSAAKAGDDPR